MASGSEVSKQVRFMCLGCSRVGDQLACSLFSVAEQMKNAQAGACDRAMRTSPDGQSMTHEGRIRGALGRWGWRRTLPTRLPVQRRMRRE